MVTTARSRRSPRDAAAPRPDWRLTTERLVVVAGKGGVGRSTVAAALGVAAARRGLRTALVEVTGDHDTAARAPETDSAIGRAATRPGLEHVTVDRRAALRDYLRAEVPGGLPLSIVARNRMFELFVDAAPGLAELLTIGEVCNLAQPRGRRRGGPRYDLVVLDGPASGHLLGLLTAPRTFASIARVGPVATQATAIDRMLCDRALLAVIGVTTPEQMAVTETLALRAGLERELNSGFAAVVVNKVFPKRFRAPDTAMLSSAGEDPAIQSALWFDARTRAQQRQLRRLRTGLAGTPSVTLPFLFTDVLDAAAVGGLADILDRRFA